MRIRKRLFVDRKVQRALMLRALEYWFCCLATVGLAHVVWNLATNRYASLNEYFLDAWDFFLPATIVSLLVLPLIMYDILKLSNRFTGPLYRVRRELRRLAAGEPVVPVRFRSDDFWLDLADEFNAAAQRMDVIAEMAEKSHKPSAPGDRPSPIDALQKPTRATQKPLKSVAAADEELNAFDENSLPESLYDLPRTKW
jgi:hypothetical protein